MEKTLDATSKKSLSLSEDWTIVLLAFAIIFMSLFLFVSPTPGYGWKSGADLSSKILTSSNLGAMFIQFLIVYVIGALAIVLTNKNLKNFLIVFPIIFLLTIFAQVVAGNASVKALNLEAVIFSLSLGLIVGNAFKLPDWFRSALSAELFVKIGLVLLGTAIIFGDILKAGSLGLVQAILVVISVWYFAFWLGKKLKLDDELNMMLASAVSICGVSAAIATAGAITGDSKKLSYVISLVLITAIPMMIFMPLIAKSIGLSEEVTGAWLGGTIDTTGAVVASGTLVGETALKISTIVKFSQNVLLGLAAFAISIYWTYSKDKKSQTETPTAAVIWERFPKFVLGFVAASLIFSFLLSPEKIASVKDSLKSIQTLWFVLAFTSIGLETRFADLASKQGARPLTVFLIAQGFNIIVTLFIAYLLF
jgi:uncharacterized integral membrane protein (TIGR00698 family)